MSWKRKPGQRLARPAARRLLVSNGTFRDVFVPRDHAWMRFMQRLPLMHGMNAPTTAELLEHPLALQMLLRQSFARTEQINGCKVGPHRDRFGYSDHLPSWQVYDAELDATYVVVRDSHGYFLKTVLIGRKSTNHGAREGDLP